MHLLHLPKLGYTMENGSITGWLVDEGSTFEIGEALYEVETEKNVVQVEARLPGTLAKVVVDNDDSLGIGALVAVIADPGEELDAAAVRAAIDADQQPDADIADGDHDDDTAAAADPTTQLAAPVEGPAALASSPAGRVRALPKVRAAADRLGVDLASLVGTGPRGTLTVADVERAAADGESGSPVPAGAVERERRRLTGVRKAMASGVAASWTEVPQFVQQFRVDVSEVMQFRATLKERGQGVGLTAVLAAAIAHAVQVVPEVNSSFAGEEVVLYRDVNVGIAVRSDRGLVVPTVAEVDALGVTQIDLRIRSVVDDARLGSLPSDVSTITLSNLGGYGVETGMPLVSRGQTAIVFTGDVVETPVVEEGAVVVRPMLGIAVGFDHRVIDGSTGGEFCRALRTALEKPEVLAEAVRQA